MTPEKEVAIKLDPETKMPRVAETVPANSITAFIAQQMWRLSILEPLRDDAQKQTAYRLLIEKTDLHPATVGVLLQRREVEMERSALSAVGCVNGNYYYGIVAIIPVEFRERLNTSTFIDEPVPLTRDYKESELFAAVIWMLRTLHYTNGYQQWASIVKETDSSETRLMYEHYFVGLRDGLMQMLTPAAYAKLVEYTGFYRERELI